MPSRMDRYYREELVENRRTKKNEKLYKNIYNNDEYSNIEGIASISKKGEIDLEKLKEMLQKREDREKERKYRTAKITPITLEEVQEEEKNYDIRDVLVKAKSEQKEDNRHRSLDHVDHDFLKSLQEKNIRANEDPDKTDDLTGLLSTITNKRAFEKMKDEELSLDMLSELKPTGNTVADNEAIRKLIEEELEKSHTKEKQMDQTFFTTSHNFKAEDFESFEDIKTDIKKNNRMVTIMIYFLIAIAVIIVAYFIVKLWL